MTTVWDGSRPAKDIFASIADPVAWWAERFPDTEALAEGGRVMSYGETDARSTRLAATLADRGLAAGDRFYIVGENGFATALSVLAAAKLGAWAIPINARLSAGEIDAIRDHARPRLALYTQSVSDEATAHGARHGARPVAELDDLGAALAAFDDADPAVDESGEDPADRVAVMIYTSGTTGKPKGVMLTHRNLLFIGARSGESRRVTPGDRIYGVLPISHVFGLASVYLGNMYMGGRVDLIPRFSAEHALAAIEGGEISLFNGVPQMYARILELTTIRGRPLDPGRIRYLSSGGAPLDLGLKKRVEAAFGVPLHNGYGMTETAPTISVTDIDRPRDDDTVGEIIPDVQVRIVADDGEILPPDTVGEIQVSGPLVMKGYYKAPEETAAVHDGLWFRTGDLGRLTADGLLYVVGRRKELIIRSGFNVYPPEVEAAITLHPDVALCAVVGRPVKDGNEEVVAFVQPVQGRHLTAGDLSAFVTDKLSAYKRPGRWEFRDSLPATAAGKILKHKLDG
jgi:acyl-CoA synthetase (AMP-forming)/AMP-acid ligase II